MTDRQPQFDQIAALVSVSRQPTIERLSRRFDVRLFGAIGDGQRVPLSRRFDSLSDARQMFPHATALSDTVDWCAIQAAVNAAKASGGGFVLIPAGTYMMGSSTLVMPDSPTGEDANDAVVVGGEGIRNTVLRWEIDTAGDAWAVRLVNRHNYSRVVLQDMHLMGPAGHVERGRVPCRLRGVACSSGWRLERLAVDHFYADVGIWDDHTVHMNCEYGRGSYYGIYFDDGSIDFGDHLFFRCNVGQTLKACVAVAPTNQIEHTLFVDCHMGWSPYVFYGERGTPTRAFMTNTRILKVQAESVGNAWLYSENFDSGVHKIDKCVFEDVQFLRNAQFALPRAEVVFCRVNAVWNTAFVGPHTIFGRYYEEMTGPYFDVRLFQSNTFSRGYHDLVMGSSAEKPMIRASAGCIFNTLRDGEQFEGEIRLVDAAVEPGASVFVDGLGAKVGAGTLLGLAAVGARAGTAVPVVTRGLLQVGGQQRYLSAAVQVTPA